MVSSLPVVLDAAAVSRLLPQVDVVATIRELFQELGAGTAVQPPQSLTLFPNEKGDFISYLGVLSNKGVFGVKLSPYIVTSDRPVITAWTSLISMTSGQPLLLCDSAELTVERTAGTTAVAVDELSRPWSKRLAIIGSGPVATAHWKHVRNQRGWEQVAIWSPRLQDRPDIRAAWEASDVRIKLASSAQAACEDADVVLLCTSSGTPVIDPAWIPRHALVTSISTNVAQAHEVPPSFLATADVYCDYRKTTPLSAGDMLLAVRDYAWSAASIKGDLAELATNQCARPTGDRPVFFRSIGLGLEDIAMAEAILRASRHN